MAPKCDFSGLRGFLILMYKGLLLRKRHYIVTIFEIVLPVFLASIPAIVISEANISGSYSASSWVNDTYYDPVNPFKKDVDYNTETEVFLAYAPSNSQTNKLIGEAVHLYTTNNPKISVIGNKSLANAEDLEIFCIREQRESGHYNKLILGIVFNNIHDTEQLPSALDYTIRYNDYRLRMITDKKYQFTNEYLQEYYSETSFLTWQATIEKVFIQEKATELKKPLDYDIKIQRFPYPAHKYTDGFSVSSFIPVILTYCFICFVINLIKRVIEEKSNGSKELLKMMGMTNGTYWISTFFNFFWIGVLAMLIITIIYKSPLKHSVMVLQHSDFMIIFIVFSLFIANVILFCFAITCFFNKPVFGVISMMVVYIVCASLLSSMIFIMSGSAPSPEYLLVPKAAKIAICFFPPGALYSAFQIVTVFEMSSEGAQWFNLYSYDALPDFNLGEIMLYQLLSVFVYIVIIWYVDAVWPWQFGVPKPVYFLFTKSYWCGYEDVKCDDILLGPESISKSTEFFEEDPIGVSPGVVIDNLSKVFRTGFQTKVAVDNVSLNIYNGQITALLGHNGAGKTTTINILTGLYSPSSGSATINGYDIFKQTTKARQSLGVCPQHNVLYDTLTVEEHLKLYAALKGVSWSELDKETTGVLTMLSLIDKKTELARNLSGGMKRKLSLGIAIIGGSKVLFLDEPTSGMDVEARRSVWDALLEIRHNRTIILTTHYMEEADTLGDRIAIMADGQIQCCGSPLFLKKKFGTGYHLHMVKNDNFELSVALEILKKYVPEATLENEFEKDITFNLMSNNSSSYGPLFEEIEQKKDLMGINSCGVTVTTMEDVFLNVSNIADLKASNQENHAFEEAELRDIYIQSHTESKDHNCDYYLNQFRGLIMKRFHYSKRHWGILITQIVLPFMLLCLLLHNIKMASDGNTMYSNSLSMNAKNIYGKTDGFYSFSIPRPIIADKYKEILQNNTVNFDSISDPDEFILNYAMKDIGHYMKSFLVGGSIMQSGQKLSLTAWYNALPYHAQPISLTLMNSAILKSLDKSGYIALTSHPLPTSHSYSSNNDHTLERILANVFLPLAFSFVSSCFVLVPIHERASKAKLIQLMTGISAAFYWLAMFVWDFFISICISIVLIIPFAIFTPYAFFAPHSEAIGTTLLIMILYSWASVPFSYLFTLIFQKPNTGFSVVNAFCVIVGVAVSSILTQLSGIADNNYYVILFSWLFRIFPIYSLGSGFGKLFAIAFSNAYCESLNPKELEFSCDPKYVRPGSAVYQCCKDICGNQCLIEVEPITFERKGCAAELLFLFGSGFIYFFLLLLFESSIMSVLCRVISQTYYRLRLSMVNQITDNCIVEDSEVLQEEERIQNNFEQAILDEALVVINLSKHFGNLKAVDSLTFGIHKTECFGLLGVNGAGKTTTFRMLTGDCYPDSGNAHINKYSVISNLKKFQSYIGYCPQFDALIDRLSAREMITLFARLRGLSGDRLEKTVNSLIKMTDLTKYADKPSMVYSGGNKRKLSIALALIGSPPLLLLDEPTAGVDPVSRRKIWTILSLARKHTEAAVILTTHSMEESEALCSRLAIMVNGRFRCLGSIQQLKTKFGQGYTLIIKIGKEEQDISTSMNAIKEYIDTNLPGAQLKDDHQGMLQYHVIDPTVTLSFLFKFMDEMKVKCSLEDYVISDTSLEQIFLGFARSQRVVALT